MTTAGVLALQGDVSEHIGQLRALGIDGVAVKNPADLAGVEALIIPGGESTAISRLVQTAHLFEPLQAFARIHPVLGTCAGLIMCSREVADGANKVAPLGLIDIRVRRNGFGRQIDSFETTLPVAALGTTIPAVFIRAPYIETVGDNVAVLARYDNRIVLAEQGNILVCSFHPELTGDTALLDYFIRKI
ncbi:pyridoxal 5'-phosphate synthase glutaminase subunit PdxT [Sodalis sp. RH21]|uniref:pyridoxal 5'-phosphate synthase glutaminase subunit PdxT n=1 Tax=unclassified Sodalis (in: enterobacteria) TaxID=2636512 RepID=UPI0039B5F28B